MLPEPGGVIVGKKMKFLLLPALFAPYVIVGCMLLTLFSNKFELADLIWETVFFNNGLLMLAEVFLYCVVSIGCTGVYALVVLRKDVDVLDITRTIMIIKLLQIPAYVFIFGIAFCVLLLAVPIMFFCYMAFLGTAIAGCAAVCVAKRRNMIIKGNSETLLVLQFVCVADVVAIFILYRNLRQFSRHKL